MLIVMDNTVSSEIFCKKEKYLHFSIGHKNEVFHINVLLI